MRSYVENQKGYEHIELLEDCELYQLDAEELKSLYEQDIAIANWGRRFAEQELIKTEAMFISRQFRTARERYVELITGDPELLHRVQLSHVASYLGITQVSSVVFEPKSVDFLSFVKLNVFLIADLWKKFKR